MKQLLGNSFIKNCRSFLISIEPQIKQIIIDAAAESGYQGRTTLILPTDNQLALIPDKREDVSERIRYLIKQFPKLKNISISALETILIINNENSTENETLIDYLKYEYLYEKRVNYKTCPTGKERFHKAKII